MDQVARHLDKNTRRRYLYTLVLFNDREKADFNTIKEESSLEESKSSLNNSMKKKSSGSQLERLASLRKLVNKHERDFKSNINRSSKDSLSHREV